MKLGVWCFVFVCRSGVLGVLSVSAFHGTAVDGFQCNLTRCGTAVLRQYATHLLETIPAARFIRKLAKPTLRNAPAGRDDHAVTGAKCTTTTTYTGHQKGQSTPRDWRLWMVAYLLLPT